MKKLIIFTLLVAVAGAAVAGGIYYQKKDQLAQLEKAGFQMLAEGLGDDLKDEAVPAQSKTLVKKGALPEGEGDGTGSSPSTGQDQEKKNPSESGNIPEGITPGLNQEANGSKESDGTPPVNNEDRMTAAKIILSKIPAGELKRLTNMAKGGVTTEEKQLAKSILKSRLSTEDIDKLKKLARKYNM